jgi:DNA-binding HxlR family transcriptional regulator
LNRTNAIRVFLAVFASICTILALYFYFQSISPGGSACLNPPCATPPKQPELAVFPTSFAIISVSSWAAFGFALAFWRQQGSGNSLRFSLTNAGFDKNVYDLMVKMRGSGSRLSILQGLVEAPRHRNQLSEITGIDWKEVDRQVGLLERYGFVSVNAQAGPIKEYKLTEQGRLLVKLMDELGKTQQETQ